MKNPSILLILIVLPVLPSCQTGGGNSSEKVTALAPSQKIVQFESYATETDTDLHSARVVIEGMSPANVEAQKPVAVVHIDAAAASNQRITKEAPAVAKEAAGTEKQVEALKKSDPVRTWLKLGGIILIVAGVIGMIVGYLPMFKTFAFLESAALSSLLAGLAFVTIAHYLTQIYIAGGITLLVVAAWFLWSRRSLIKMYLPIKPVVPPGV